MSTSIGEERMKGDMRQYGGLSFGYSALVVIRALTDIVSLANGDGTTPTSGLPLYNLISACCLAACGIFGMYHGWTVCVMDKMDKKMTALAIFFTQLSWLPFIGALVGTGINASKEGGDRFVGAMAILSILSYAAAFVGSLGFMQFTIYAYQNGAASDRAGGYFRARTVYYNFLVFIAGLSQLMLGAYLLSTVGGGPLQNPVIAAMITVHFPEISVFMGIFQVIMASFGWARRFGVGGGVKGSSVFAAMCWFHYLLVVVLQNMVQVGYGVGMVARGPTTGAVFLALPTMPAFLDWKASTLPNEFSSEYYKEEQKTLDP